MALEPTTDQRDLRDTVRGFCTATAEHDAATIWTGLVELGVTEIPFPVEAGGAGCTLADTAVVVSELGRALSPAPYLPSLGAALFLGHDPARAPDGFGALVRGERIGALVDGADPAADLVLDVAGDAPVLRGTHRAVPAADVADVLCVVLAGPDGSHVVAVDPGHDQVTVTPLPSLDPSRPLCRVEFHGVAVPVAPAAPDGLRYARAAVSVLLAAEQCGGARSCVDRSVEYARTRTQFGRPIGSFQAVKHKIVDMHVGTELAEAAVLGALELLDDPGADPVQTDLAAHVARATASRAFTHAAAEAVQVHGGIGFSWEFPLHRYVRRARTTALLGGGPAEHHRCIARLAASAPTA